MKHDFRHKLSDYLDGAVTAIEKAEIEEHLKACEKCSDALAELQKTIEQVKQVEDVEPPAWMTQKIMAKVREESKEKAGTWNMLLFPLRMRPAVGALAVLFLAVTSFYIYTNIQPELKYAEAPMEEGLMRKNISAPAAPAPKGKAPAPAHAQDKIGRIDDSSLRARQVPQAEGYKSLDMKYEYEKPALPAPKEEAAAPATASPARTKAEEQPALGGETVKMRNFYTPKVPAADSDQNIIKEKKAALPAKREERAPSMGIMAQDEARSAATLPKFEDYPVTAIFTGEPAPVDFTSHPNARTYRTMLKRAAEKGPNFAGHYTIATWDCGTSCISIAIVDAITGSVFFPPELIDIVSWDWEWRETHGLDFRIDSKLLVVHGNPSTQNQIGIFSYVWADTDLQLMRSELKK